MIRPTRYPWNDLKWTIQSIGWSNCTPIEGKAIVSISDGLYEIWNFSHHHITNESRQNWTHQIRKRRNSQMLTSIWVDWTVPGMWKVFVRRKNTDFTECGALHSFHWLNKWRVITGWCNNAKSSIGYAVSRASGRSVDNSQRSGNQLCLNGGYEGFGHIRKCGPGVRAIISRHG
jgi:hypothetical protein